MDTQLLFEDIGVLSLHPLRHGVPHIRISLMAVESPDFYRPPIEEKAFFGKAGIDVYKRQAVNRHSAPLRIRRSHL